MGMYARLAVPVEANQWFPPGDPRHDPKATPVVPPYRCGISKEGDILHDAGVPVYMVLLRYGSAMSWKRLTPGDWLVREANGLKWYSAKRFAAEYVAAPTPADAGPVADEVRQ